MASLMKNPQVKNIAQVRNTIGDEATKAAVYVMVDDLQKSIQLTQAMTPFQIDVAADIICKEYYYLKLEEVRLCFTNAISGKYGKIYNRIDAAVICEWLAAYVSKRASVSERLNAIEQQTNNIYDVFNNDVMADALRTVVDKLTMKEESMDVPFEPRRDPTPFEKQIMDEWDKLERDETTPQFRVYGSSWYDFSAYRIMRYKQEWNNQEDEE